MASQIPCKICEEVADADFLITARTEATDMPPGTTFGCCISCLIGFALAKVAEAMPAAPEPEPEPEPEPPRRKRTRTAAEAPSEPQGAPSDQD